MEDLSFEVTVKNVGDYDADEVSLDYPSPVALFDFQVFIFYCEQNLDAYSHYQPPFLLQIRMILFIPSDESKF